MNTNDINPYIRVSMRGVLSEHFHIKSRVIYDYEIIYLEKGSWLMKYNGRSYTCKQGDIIFIRPGIEHNLRGVGVEVFQPHIHFDFIYTPESPQIPVSFKNKNEMSQKELKWIRQDVIDSPSLSPFIHFSDMPRFFDLFYKIVSSPVDKNRLYKKALLTEIIDMLLKDNFPLLLQTTPSNDYSAAQQIKDYIDAGQGLKMELTDFEKQFNYSKFHLEKEFKKLCGMGIISYRNSKRMELSKKLLKEYSITAVAEKTGYSSIYSFSRAYKNYYGECPSKIKAP